MLYSLDRTEKRLYLYKQPFMKRFLLILSALAAICSCSVKPSEPRISIFAQHIDAISKQEGISYAEAATLVKQMGYEGVDIKEKASEEQIRILDSVGFAHASAITYIYFTDGEKLDEITESIAWLKSHDFERTLLVPGFFKEEPSEEDMKTVADRIAVFTEMAAKEGILVMVEDYDNSDSPCCDIKRLTTLFSASEKMGHVHDSGNFLSAGEDCLVALDKFISRIGHVHLKDRISAEEMECPPVGTGCIPIKEVIRRLVRNGYDGWLTVEQFGSKSMLKDCKTSYANVRAAIDEALGHPTEKSEPKVSIFEWHIDTVAKQEDISYAEAAARVYELGYRGVDIAEKTPEEEIHILDSIGFAHASAITYINFTDGDMLEESQESIDWLKFHGFDRTLLVPGVMQENFTADDMAIVAGRIAAYAGKAADEGILIQLEDFGNPLSPCFNTERLSTLFAASDKLGHVMDTGNWLIAGENCLDALEKFCSRVGHVHLKDHISPDDMSCPPVGAGCVPIRQVVTTLIKNGYDGWFTVEQFGVEDMIKDAETSYANIKAIIEEAQK